MTADRFSGKLPPARLQSEKQTYRRVLQGDGRRPVPDIAPQAWGDQPWVISIDVPEDRREGLLDDPCRAATGIRPSSLVPPRAGYGDGAARWEEGDPIGGKEWSVGWMLREQPHSGGEQAQGEGERSACRTARVPDHGQQGCSADGDQCVSHTRGLTQRWRHVVDAVSRSADPTRGLPPVRPCRGTILWW